MPPSGSALGAEQQPSDRPGPLRPVYRAAQLPLQPAPLPEGEGVRCRLLCGDPLHHDLPSEQASLFQPTAVATEEKYSYFLSLAFLGGGKKELSCEGERNARGRAPMKENLGENQDDKGVRSNLSVNSTWPSKMNLGNSGA